MKFHVHRDGSGFGPYDETEARSLYAQGNIAATDLVWHDGMPQWLAAQQVFGASPMAAPPVPQPHSAMLGLPLPPKLHWGLVLLFSVLTVGIFAIVWMFIQSAWVRKIDARSKATKYLIGYLVLALGGSAMEELGSTGTQGLGLFLQLLSYVLFYCGYYSMRRSMLDYYNSVEPIGLKLSSALLFFFSMLYLQHHMTRIAQWKLGGALRPQ